MKFHRDGTLPQNNEIWVFGSNLAGIHGAGAAKVAHDRFGARWGEGTGLTGRSYAIPTKNEQLRTLPIWNIEIYVHEFIRFAALYPELQFFITSVGCGLAGYQHSQIAPLFANAPDNCSFPHTWEPYLGEALKKAG